MCDHAGQEPLCGIIRDRALHKARSVLGEKIDSVIEQSD